MEPQGESNPAEEQRLIDAFNELSSRLDKTSEDPLVDSLVACASLPNDATTWRKALSLAGVSNNSVRTGVQAAVAMAVATWMHFTTWTYNAFNG